MPLAFAATPGLTNVSIAPLQTQALNPGNYGTLIDNGTVLLNPGTYSFSGVTMGNNAQLLAQPGGPTSVRIAGALLTGQWAHIQPVLQTANKLAIFVSGADGAGGSPAARPSRQTAKSHACSRCRTARSRSGTTFRLWEPSPP